MAIRREGALRYAILDPTGNITALVRDAVAPCDQPAVASRIMAAHPEVEQVGFMSYEGAGDGSIAGLRMAGGEFCGNASMSAAALYCWDAIKGAPETSAGDTAERCLLLRVSGAEHPVEVRLRPEGAEAFSASIRMPEAEAIDTVSLSFEGIEGAVPVVRMQGISHAIILPGSTFFPLLGGRAAAERAVRAWCGELGFEGLGLMFLEGTGESRRCTPLVYVPGADTVFWESSCASGSSAVGMWHAKASGGRVSLVLDEPGGVLRVACDPATRETWLSGHVRRLGEGTVS